MKKQAGELFREKDYAAALSAFTACEKLKKGDAEVLSGLGACYFERGDLGEAETKLYAAAQSKKSPPSDAWLYLAKIHHERFQFEEAIVFYKKFLRATAPGHPLRASVKDDILRCGNGIHVRRQKSQAAVVNMGRPLNSAGDEFSPVFPPDMAGRLYFAKAKLTAENEQLASDLYFSELENGDWAVPRPLSFFLNSTGHEVPLAFDEKGEMIYFFRGKTLFSGDILQDTLRENNVNGTLFVDELKCPLRAPEGDQGLFFFTDSILLFASRRPGGYGGLDLYVATLRTDGWSAAENLGPVINSAYDETSPFLASDGRTLYFSTNDARRSIGGLDLMRSVFLDRTRKWIPAENLGTGFNSAGDDDHIFLSPDGSRAFFSSSRKQGLGQRDLYVGIFEKTKTEQLHRSEPVAFHFVRPAEKTKAATVTEAPPPSAMLKLKLHPLHFPEPNMPLTDASFAKLKELAGWMKKQPGLKVTFVAHSASGDERDICQTALRQVVEVLQREGVALENVVLRNAAAAFPLSENDDRANRRIDIILANPEVLPVEVVVEKTAGSRASFFQKAMGRLMFQVKIPVGENGTPEALFQNFPKGNLLEHPSSGQVGFVHGIYLTWNSAAQAKDEMEKNGFPGAQVVPFLKGWELSKNEAQTLVEDYPGLANFIGQ